MTGRAPNRLRATSDWVGQTVGNYRLVRLLGEGGMGMVFEAYNEGAGGRAAVKILRPEVSFRADIAARFFNEARAANLIQHPGIVRVFDCGHTPDGSAFLTMEFLDGESLRSLLDRIGKLQSIDVVRLGRQMASALTAAHRKDIVHRDLKPDNLMLIRDPDMPGGERVKILDFGIAKIAEGLGGIATVTDSNVVMGTPAYMAPEQCKGAKLVTDRSDVYSLGIIFYQMLAGRPPFVADAAGALLIMQVTESVPLLTGFAPDAVPLLAQLTHAMLAKEPTARPAMESVLAELQRIETASQYGAAASSTSGPSLIPTLPLLNPRQLLSAPSGAPSSGAHLGKADGLGARLHGSTVTGAASESRRRSRPQRIGRALLALGVTAGLFGTAGFFSMKMRGPHFAALLSPRPAPGSTSSGLREPSARLGVSETVAGPGKGATAASQATEPASAPRTSPTAAKGKPSPSPLRASPYQVAQRHFDARRYAEAIKAAEKCGRDTQMQCSIIRAKAACRTDDRQVVSMVVSYLNEANPPNKEKWVRAIKMECEEDSLAFAEKLISSQKYQQAQSVARSNRVFYIERAWDIIGQAACGLHDAAGARQAASHLESAARIAKQRAFCLGQGMSLP